MKVTYQFQDGTKIKATSFTKLSEEQKDKIKKAFKLVFCKV